MTNERERSWATGALDPRDAISTTIGEMYALAGKPLPTDEYFASYAKTTVYVPRIPVDAAEANGMMMMHTILTDEPNKPNYAGYTYQELSGGMAYVVAGR